MTYTKSDIDQKLRERKSLIRTKQQLEFELTLPATSSERRKELKTLCELASNELRRAEAYIELLPENVCATLKTLYFEELSHREAAAKLMVDVKTISNRKSRGLSELAVMYSRIPD